MMLLSQSFVLQYKILTLRTSPEDCKYAVMKRHPELLEFRKERIAGEIIPFKSQDLTPTEETLLALDMKHGRSSDHSTQHVEHTTELELPPRKLTKKTIQVKNSKALRNLIREKISFKAESESNESELSEIIQP